MNKKVLLVSALMLFGSQAVCEAKDKCKKRKDKRCEEKKDKRCEKRDKRCEKKDKRCEKKDKRCEKKDNRCEKKDNRCEKKDKRCKIKCKKICKNAVFQGSTGDSETFIPLQNHKGEAVTLRIENVDLSEGISLTKNEKSLRVECDGIYSISLGMIINTEDEADNTDTGALKIWIEISDDCCNWTKVEGSTKTWSQAGVPATISTSPLASLKCGDCIRFRAQSFNNPNLGASQTSFPVNIVSPVPSSSQNS